MKTIVFAILVFASTLAFGQNKEVLMLDQGTGPGKGQNFGIYLHRENVEPEHIPHEKISTLYQAQLLFSTISKLYKEGWEVVATINEGYWKRYIFEREKP